MELFFSPHFDDAVLSCGGMIHKLAQERRYVRVMTLMAQDMPPNPPNTPIVRDLHTRWKTNENPVKMRRLEDEKAIEGLGALFTHVMMMPDCVYRVVEGEVLYPSEASLFGDVHPKDDVNKLYEYSLLYHPETLYLPLAVGNHVDHQIVRDLGRRLKHDIPKVRLLFYEDYPYSRDKNATAQALDRLKKLESTMYFEPQIVELSEEDVNAKIRAAACYQSQISTFWDSLAQMEREIRQDLLETGGGKVYAERCWLMFA